jgi:cardiolipin synthase
MTLFFGLELVYMIIIFFVCLRVINDTRSTTKTLAYLLLVIFIPFLGVVFYLAFGINHRSSEMYSKKLMRNDELADKLHEDLYQYSIKTFNNAGEAVRKNNELAYLLFKDAYSPLTGNNSVKILVNGENKFPEVLEALEQAHNHIHIEYYIYEDDEIGRAIDILKKKAQEGVIVRFIYDDFGSRSIRKKCFTG